ncbi:PREDICTED: uncharacterized protein LOC106811014 [Priapulus caudatus]|uniref:Uncharacterized protein LOC106811014 n=1 Tax=Priapulus caudatus TaxID=37621 RepID=A0ABM1ECU6_PRICU|nr:PREDICTED: uncharacterized protein LOC106811014 [Priapulus caudatus]
MMASRRPASVLDAWVEETPGHGTKTELTTNRRVWCDMGTQAGRYTATSMLIMLTIIPLAVLIMQNAFILPIINDAMQHTELLHQRIMSTFNLKDIIHTIQVERGTAVLALISDDTKLKRMLRASYIDTTDAIAAYGERDWPTIAEHLGPEFRSSQSLTRYLIKHRREIDYNSAIAASETRFYTGIIKVLIDWIGEMVLQYDGESFVWRNLMAYHMLIISKEYTDAERALGTTYYSLGKFDIDNHSAFLSASVYGKLYLDSASRFNENLRNRLNNIINTTSVVTINDLKENLTINVFQPPNLDDGLFWFNSMTVFINFLSEQETRVGQEILDQLKYEAMWLSNKKMKHAFMVALGAVCLLIIVGFLHVYIAREIHRSYNAYNGLSTKLKKEMDWAQTLIYQMLPESVAERLANGEPINPEGFSSATIFFSDIVGFTSISSGCTPLEVVRLLNNLYSIMDDVCEKHDAYKVETIGDAYMVASGLPKRNADRHFTEIADLALEMRDAVRRLKVPKSNAMLKLRIGVHSGPVVAGVVGQKMPRYCLVGDTVAIAARMEQTGLPLKIHISERTYRALNRTGFYEFDHRGEVDLKDGERIHTYWLLRND